MQPLMPNKAQGSSVNPGPWYRWRGYAVRWLLFGGIVGLAQPLLDASDHYWLEKLRQGLFGLFFGVVCTVIFTLSENRFNGPRVTWRSWLLVIATWLLVKLVFVSVLAATGPVN
ncbi:MAG: hypothetical protein ACI9I0_001555 [Rhodoferax sp.]|jgi:hypothetical protein